MQRVLINEMSLNIITSGAHTHAHDSNCEIINIPGDLNFVDFVGTFYHRLHHPQQIIFYFRSLSVKMILSMIKVYSSSNAQKFAPKIFNDFTISHYHFNSHLKKKIINSMKFFSGKKPHKNTQYFIQKICKDDTLLNDIAPCNAILRKKITEEMLTLVIILSLFLFRPVFKFHKVKKKQGPWDNWWGRGINGARVLVGVLQLSKEY